MNMKITRPIAKQGIVNRCSGKRPSVLAGRITGNPSVIGKGRVADNRELTYDDSKMVVNVLTGFLRTL
jgi:hypothetical protein